MQQACRILILAILLLSVASIARPAYAQVAIAVDPPVINTYMGTYVTARVTVTSIDLLPHTVTLYVSAGGPWWGPWWSPASFSPNPVNVPAGGSALSTLTLAVPDICQNADFPGPYSLTFTIEGQEGAMTVASATLLVNMMYGGPPLSISIASSKSSYVVGETVSLQMSSNLPAYYSLKIRKPDGGVWKSATGILPATFSKPATEPFGTYTAELTAHYCGIAYSTTSFSVGPATYDVTISFAGLPTDVATGLSVDGVKVADLRGGDVWVRSYPIGTAHTFQVDQYVSGASGYRYYCASNSWTTTAEGSNVFNYASQVYLEVNTDPEGIAEVTPSGWYAVGSSASISAVATELEGSAGVKYRFVEWTVDGVKRAENGFVLFMDAPHKVIAKFDTLYRLTVLSDYGNPTGDDYYKAGETAAFSVTSPVGFGIQQVFVEWTGDYTGKEPTGTIVMDSPKTVRAVWTTSYTQLYLIVGVIAVIAVVGALLLWRRRRAAPAAVKPPPPPPTEATQAATTEPESAAPAPVVTKRCTNCGHELGEGQDYCPECGQKLTD